MTIDFTACYHLFFAIMFCFNLLLSWEEIVFTPVLYWDQIFSCISNNETVTYKNINIVLSLWASNWVPGEYCIVIISSFVL